MAECINSGNVGNRRNECNDVPWMNFSQQLEFAEVFERVCVYVARHVKVYHGRTDGVHYQWHANPGGHDVLQVHEHGGPVVFELLQRTRYTLRTRNARFATVECVRFTRPFIKLFIMLYTSNDRMASLISSTPFSRKNLTSLPNTLNANDIYTQTIRHCKRTPGTYITGKRAGHI